MTKAANPAAIAVATDVPDLSLVGFSYLVNVVHAESTLTPSVQKLSLSDWLGGVNHAGSPFPPVAWMQNTDTFEAGYLIPLLAPSPAAANNTFPLLYAFKMASSTSETCLGKPKDITMISTAHSPTT